MSVNKVAVIGSGLMGHGIAQVAATSGQEVSLIDISDDLLNNAMQKIKGSLTRLSEKGRIQDSPDNILKRIKTTTSLPNGVSDADYIIEAVPEVIGLKKEVASKIDTHAPGHAIIATNTSGLSTTVIAEATNRKEKVIGMHWFNPAQIMRLIEIVKSKYTDDETLQITLDQCKRYGKETVIAQKDIWCLLSGRAHTGFQVEANLMYLNKEADVKEIDAMIRYKIGLPMGTFELMDFTGSPDIRPRGLKSVEEITKTFPEFEPSPMFLAVNKYLVKEVLEPRSQKGLSGVKTGKGFYTYPEGKYAKPEIPVELAEKVDPIQILAPAINAAAWCVTNGVGTVDDINKVFRLAYGWPKGIFEFVDELGIDNIINVLKAKEEKAPDWLKEYYKVDPLLSSWRS